MILNLTQHPASAEQLEAGVVDLGSNYSSKLKELLTFSTIPTASELTSRCDGIYDLVLAQLATIGHIDESFYDDYDMTKNLDESRFRAELNISFMIGGAPYLMGPLQSELSNLGTVLYAYSNRVSVEETQADGSVRKVNVFKHIGFVEALLD